MPMPLIEYWLFIIREKWLYPCVADEDVRLKVLNHLYILQPYSSANKQQCLH